MVRHRPHGGAGRGDAGRVLGHLVTARQMIEALSQLVPAFAGMTGVEWFAIAMLAALYVAVMLLLASD